VAVSDRAARWIADVAVATMALWTWVLFAAINTTSVARIEFLVDFTAQKPFVTRALVPGLIRVGESILPDLGWLAGYSIVAATLRAYTLDFIPTPPTQAILAFVIMAGFTLLAIRAMRRLLATEAPGLGEATRSALAWLTPCALLVLMPGRNAFGRPYLGMIYDPATLGLVALCLALMAERRWRAYVVAFCLAAVNRETAVYLLPVFGLFGWWTLDRRRFVSLLAVQVAAFVAIRGVLEWAAHGLPTYNPGIKLAILPASDFLPVGMETIGVLAVLAVFVVARLSTRGLALASLVMLPVATVAYLLAGEPGEYRVFLEVTPVFVLAVGVLAAKNHAPVLAYAPHPTTHSS
jgi:hypothetical protein